MTDRKLKRFAKEFRDGILDGRPSEMMCFAVCAPLQSMLDIAGVNTELVTAEFAEVNHVWLRLDDRLGRPIDRHRSSLRRAARRHHAPCANARLIASSPALLAALKAVMAARDDSGPDCQERWRDAWLAATAAIALAEGVPSAESAQPQTVDVCPQCGSRSIWTDAQSLRCACGARFIEPSQVAAESFAERYGKALEQDIIPH